MRLILLLLLVYQTLQQIFPCNISNCAVCSLPNFCSLCENNYILSWTPNNISGGTSCISVSCPGNCETCYQNNICEICFANYYLTIEGECSEIETSNNNIGQNCIWGYNNTNCGLCSYGYTLNIGLCYPNIEFTSRDQNCLVKYSSEICSLCENGYIVNFLGQCILNTFNINQTCNIQYCNLCYNSTSCMIWQNGYMSADSSNSSAVLNTCFPFCISCPYSDSQCQQCAPGYTLFNYQCIMPKYTCNIANCVICATSNQNCSQCVNGYDLTPYTYNNNTIYLCKVIICPYNITNCVYCDRNFNTIYQFNQILCQQCEPNYLLVNGYCVPSVSSNTNCSIPNTCIQCLPNNNYFCISCDGYNFLTLQGNCQPSINIISTCQSNSLIGICTQCRQGYFSYMLINDLLPFYNSSSYSSINYYQYLFNLQCTFNQTNLCGINCFLCNSTNTNNITCVQCVTGYLLINNNCIINCNVTNCLFWNNTICQQCLPGYQLNSTSNECVSINYTCDPNCNTNNNASSCIYNWITNKGECIQCNPNVHPNYILYNGQCYSPTCSIWGCDICSPQAYPQLVCLRCQQSFVLQNGYCLVLNCSNSIPNCANSHQQIYNISYSIQIQNLYQFEFKILLYLQLRDPRGWTKADFIVNKQLKCQNENGQFYIKFEDLINNFQVITVSRYLPKSFYYYKTFASKQLNQIGQGVIQFQTKQSVQINISIHQKHKKFFDEKYQYNVINVMICKINNQLEPIKCIKTNFNSQQVCSISLTLQKGKYIIIGQIYPFKTNKQVFPEQKITLSINTTKQLYDFRLIQNYNTKKALILYIQQNKHEFKQLITKQNLIRYHGSLFGKMCILYENLSGKQVIQQLQFQSQNIQIKQKKIKIQKNQTKLITYPIGPKNNCSHKCSFKSKTFYMK